MSWFNILKLDVYTEEKLKEYRALLEREKDPKEIARLKKVIKFWENVRGK